MKRKPAQIVITVAIHHHNGDNTKQQLRVPLRSLLRVRKGQPTTEKRRCLQEMQHLQAVTIATVAGLGAQGYNQIRVGAPESKHFEWLGYEE